MTNCKERISSIREENLKLKKKLKICEKKLVKTPEPDLQDIMNLFIENVLQTIEKAQKNGKILHDIYFFVMKETKKGCLQKKEFVVLEKGETSEEYSLVEYNDFNINSIKDLNKAIKKEGIRKWNEWNGDFIEYSFLEDFLRVIIFASDTWIRVRINY